MRVHGRRKLFDKSAEAIKWVKRVYARKVRRVVEAFGNKVRRVKFPKLRRNPIGETLVTIGLNPSRRNPMRSNPDNPWYGDSGGHRIAAFMRWGKLPKGRVSWHRKRGRPRVRTVARHVVRRRRRVVHRIKRGGRIWHRRRAERSAGLVSAGIAAMGPARFIHGKGWVISKRRRKHMARHERRKSNTWFGQPRRHRKAAKKGWRKGHMFLAGKRRRRVRHANPMVGAVANPRRRHHVKHRRRHHARRHNPAMGAMLGRFTGGVMNVRSWGPLAITGGISAITGAVVPGMLGVTGWTKYGVQIGVAVGGGIVVERVVSKEHGQAWMVVGAAMVAYSLLKEFVLQPYFPQFAVGLGDYQSYYPMSAYANEDEVSQQVGAFPSSVDAFPSAMSAYPGVGETGAYPYDGAGY